jgi:cytosine/adenosine deaminase-related metal-dependent hydrolase
MMTLHPLAHSWWMRDSHRCRRCARRRSMARAMGLERQAGTVAAGRVADLVILDADPLADVQNLSRIHRVVKDRKVFAPKG